MGFTFLEGIADVAEFFIFVFQRPVYAGGETFHFPNQYAQLTAFYAFYLVPLQSWIFGMKYWESA
jgi:hypothetical protein